MPLIRQKMQDFVTNGGSTLPKNKPIFIKNTPSMIIQSDANAEETKSNMSPAERMRLKKMEEAKRREEELKNAAKEAKSNYEKANQYK